MKGLEVWMKTSTGSQLASTNDYVVNGGLFLESSTSLVSSSSVVSFASMQNKSGSVCCCLKRRRRRAGGGGFMSVTFSVKDSDQGFVVGENEKEEDNNNKGSNFESEVVEKKVKVQGGALNVTKHLWAGAVAAMVSRLFLYSCDELFLVFVAI